MSREIKFRAWDYNTKAWFKSRHDREISEELYIGLDGTVNLNTYYSGDDGETTSERSHYELMQYTGLKDKNGVEIYEGDILGKRPYGYLKSDGTKDGRYKGKEWDCFVVEWGAYDASEVGLVGGYEYETDGKYVGWNITIENSWPNDDDTTREVIGNIYENKELLG